MVFVVGGAVTFGLSLLACRIHPRIGREARYRSAGRAAPVVEPAE